MHEQEKSEQASPHKPGPRPVAAPSRSKEPPRAKGAPDLHIEEIEERHIPKDRNIFDK